MANKRFEREATPASRLRAHQAARYMLLETGV